MPQLMRPCLLIVALVGIAPALADARTWTDRTGRQLEADFIGFADGQVEITRTSDGRIFKWPLERFSDADQAFVRSQANPKPAPPKVDAPPPASNLVVSSEDWRGDLTKFIASALQTARNAKIPTERDLMNSFREKTVFTNKDGNAIWVADSSPPAGEVQAELSKQFTGKVTWEGVVESIEVDASSKKVAVEITVPAPRDLPKQIELRETVSLTFPAGTVVPAAKGQSLAFTGELRADSADAVLPPVWCIYGVGPSSGMIRIGIKLANVGLGKTTK